MAWSGEKTNPGPASFSVSLSVEEGFNLRLDRHGEERFKGVVRKGQGSSADSFLHAWIYHKV
jgi:hypothetical protein